MDGLINHDYTNNITVLESCVKRFTVSSSSPFEIAVGNYGSVIFLGFAQGIGAIAVLVGKSGSSLTVSNVRDGSAFSSAYFDIHIKSGDSNTIEVTSSVASPSSGTAFVGYIA